MMTKKRAKGRSADRSKTNLGQEEAKQEALSKEQFSHMKGGKVAIPWKSRNKRNRLSAKVAHACRLDGVSQRECEPGFHDAWAAAWEAGKVLLAEKRSLDVAPWRAEASF